MVFKEPKVICDDDEGGEALLAQQQERGIDIGSIKVELWRAIALNRRLSRQSGSRPMPGASGEVLVHDRDKKATLISHGTGLGRALKTSPSFSERYGSKKLDLHPVASFVFLYRSRNLLAALLSNLLTNISADRDTPRPGYSSRNTGTANEPGTGTRTGSAPAPALPPAPAATTTPSVNENVALDWPLPHSRGLPWTWTRWTRVAFRRQRGEKGNPTGECEEGAVEAQ
ncbi:hypothetical protein HDU93_002702, partial [Gonapodya sp. JEL0774]